MQTTINLDANTLAELGITIDQFQRAATDSLSTLTHPESGETLYFNDVRVTVIADCPEINTWTKGHAAGVTSLSQAGGECHADKPVTIGKTADAHKGLAESYQQMGVTAAEFDDLRPKP